MNDTNITDVPAVNRAIQQKSEEIGFSMPSDDKIGSLLKTLMCTKPNGIFLELGTGIGLSLSWMLDGMDENSKLTTIDNDPQLIKIVRQYFDKEERLEIICGDGGEWILNYTGPQFDLIFADTWPGKYMQLEETLALVKVGGFYIIDDMITQPNWPEGHEDKAKNLISYLEEREDFTITKMNWSTGVLIAVKNSKSL